MQLPLERYGPQPTNKLLVKMIAPLCLRENETDRRFVLTIGPGCPSFPGSPGCPLSPLGPSTPGSPRDPGGPG